MTLPLKDWLMAGGLVAVIAGGVYVRQYERHQGELAAITKPLLAELASLRDKIRADSVLVVQHDTTKVYRQVVRSDTVLQRLIDTAVVHHRDTVVVTREVLVEAKAALDSTKGVADACCTLARDRGKRLAAQDSLILVLRAQAPSFLSRHLSVGVGYGALLASGKLETGPVVSVGIRLWP